MKKILAVFIVCVIAVTSTYIATNYNVDFSSIAVDIGTFSSQFAGSSNPMYSNTVKVNKLQPKEASYNFNRLNDNQKTMYSAIAYAVKDLKNIVNLDNYASNNIDQISEDAKIVMSAFFADHPEVFYLNLTYKLSLSKSIVYDKIRIDITYSVKSKSELDEQLNKIEQVMNTYINSLSNKSDFDNELELHDAVAKDVKYYNEVTNVSDVPEEYHTIYGTFIKKQAVCDGFAKSMQLLLDRVNIENIFVTGVIDKVPHAWNMVKFGNDWYHLDLTSDKYIKESDGSTKTVVHTYFNVTDEMIMKSHTIDSKELNPVASATTYNYYIKTNNYIYSTQNFESRVKEVVAAQSNSNSLEFASDVSDVPTKLLNILYDINFNGYKDGGKNVKMKYYNEYNTYIVQKQ